MSFISSLIRSYIQCMTRSKPAYPVCSRSYVCSLTELLLLHPKSLHISHTVSNFYGTEIEIWAGFGPIMSNFWERFFHVFMVKFFFCPGKHETTALKSCFSIANRPKTNTNLNFCSIKIAHRTTYV